MMHPLISGLRTGYSTAIHTLNFIMMFLYSILYANALFFLPEKMGRMPDTCIAVNFDVANPFALATNSVTVDVISAVFTHLSNDRLHGIYVPMKTF